MTDQPEELAYRDAGGRLHRGSFVLGPNVGSPAAALPVREAVDDTGRRLVQKYVPRHLGEHNSGYYDVLDRETRALTCLRRKFEMHYPDELVKVVGYNVDVDEPFVLLTAYRGDAADQVYGNFDEEQRQRFRRGVLRALQHTSFAGVVHNAIGMPALRWDGATVQLVDFESAGRVLEPRRRDGRFPTRSREQADGVGAAHPGDDMWGVGMVFRQLMMGPHSGEGCPDLGTERLRAQLDGLFVETADQRPSSEMMLQRIRAVSDVVPDPDLEDQLRKGRQEFERASARKRGEPEPDVGGPTTTQRVQSSTGPDTTPARRFDTRQIVTAALVVVLVLVIVVALFVINNVIA